MTVKNLTDQQQHLTIRDGKLTHVVPVSFVRQVANGQKVDDKLSAIIARAYLNELGLR